MSEVVVAIKLGSVYSGFAYSFKGYQEDIKYATQEQFIQENRFPTILLLDPNNIFHSFGYKAQRTFYDLSDNDKSKFYYFENFITEINDKIKCSNQKIKDISGKKLEAQFIYFSALQHIIFEALRIIQESKPELKSTDIQWVITIPALYSDSARKFICEGPYGGGVLGPIPQIVLEPEAAALYSKSQTMPGVIPAGFQYLLADLGGETSDIYVHKTLDDGNMLEVYRATREISGGIDVDKGFISMMEALTGEEIWRDFSSTYASAYINLVNEFRLKKKEFRADLDAVSLKVENALIDHIEKKLKKSLNDVINESKYVGKLEYHSTEARLLINRDILEDLFMPSVGRIINEINEILEYCADSDINTIFLVGGFSESPYLRERIQSDFCNMRVIPVDDGRLAVLNGAVLMGWNPKNIIQRRSRYTYGFALKRQFKEGKDPVDLKIISNGKVKCKKTFRKLIGKGHDLENGLEIRYNNKDTEREATFKHRHTKRCFRLYRSTLENPKYCTKEEGCTLSAEITITLPNENCENSWKGKCRVLIGETEFTMRYFNLTTRKKIDFNLNFL